MEEKIVGNKKEGSSFSRSLSLSCIYLISHLSIYLLSLPKIYHPTLVHRQHGIPCSLWTSNTRLASPILTEDTSGMVRSETDNDKGTALPSLSTRYGQWEASRPMTRFPWMASRSVPYEPWSWSSRGNGCLCGWTKLWEQWTLRTWNEGAQCLASFVEV